MVNSWVKTHLTLPKILTTLSILFGLVGALFLAHQWIGYLIDAYAHAINFNGYPTNGAFQLFNPMRRLAAGQTPGSDFQVFHGLGVIFLHYPLFVLFGKNLFASEMARFIVSPSVFIGVVALFIYSTTRKWYFVTLGTAVMALIYYWHYLSTIQPLNSSLGVRSAMPIIIASIFVWIYSSSKTQQLFKSRFPWFELVCSLLLAVTLLMGTEHGLASVLALLVTYLIFARHKKFWSRVLGCVYIVGFYILAVGVIYFGISGIHLLEPLKYAFSEVPADQFWYFGAPPNQYLTTIFNLFKNPFIEGNILTAIGFLVLVILMHLTKKIPYTFGIIFILTYGLLSNISLLGYYEPYYTEPLSRINILVLVWLLCTAVPFFIKEYVPWVKSKSWLPAIVFGQAFFLIVTSVVVVRHLKDIDYLTPKMDFMTITDQLVKVKHSGTYLSENWMGAENSILDAADLNSGRIAAFSLTDVNWNNGIDRKWPGFFIGSSPSLESQLFVGQKLYFHQSGEKIVERIDKNGLWWVVYVNAPILDPVGDGPPYEIFIGEPVSAKKLPTIWSVYAGVLEADLGFFQPSGYDYIIHAVGPERRKEYVEAFDTIQPDYVLTMRNDFFLYEEWLRNEHWDFYQRVLNNYTIISENDFYLIWEKKPDHVWEQGNSQKWTSLSINPESTSLSLPVDAGHEDIRIYLINVEYQIKNPIKLIPYLGSLPRYLITPVDAASRTAISLPPYNQNHTFPIIVYPGQDSPYLTFHTDSIAPGPGFTITAIKYQQLELDDQQTRLFVGAPLE